MLDLNIEELDCIEAPHEDADGFWDGVAIGVTIAGTAIGVALAVAT